MYVLTTLFKEIVHDSRQLDNWILSPEQQGLLLNLINDKVLGAVDAIVKLGLFFSLLANGLVLLVSHYSQQNRSSRDSVVVDESFVGEWRLSVGLAVVYGHLVAACVSNQVALIFQVYRARHLVSFVHKQREVRLANNSSLFAANRHRLNYNVN